MLACRSIKRTVNFVILNLFSSVGIVGAAPIEVSRFLKKTGKSYSAYKFEPLHCLSSLSYTKFGYKNVEGQNMKCYF